MRTRFDPAWRRLAILLLAVAAGCGGDDPADPDPDPVADETPPAAVTDLRITSVDGSTVTVAWTAPGDDGDVGRATEYDVRWSRRPITDATWAGDERVDFEPIPQDPGTMQTVSFLVTDKADVHVALKTRDEVPNWSALSNVPTQALPELFVVHQLTSQGDNNEPYVRNGVVVWVRDRGIDGEDIYMYDLDDPTSVITRRTGSGGQKQHPTCIGRSYIVWSGRASGTEDWEIHSCSGLDLCALTQYTDNDVDDLYPVATAGFQFVWEERNGFWAQIMEHRQGYVDSPTSDICCPLYDWTVSDLDADGDWAVWRATAVDLSEDRVLLWNVTTNANYDLTDTVNAATAVHFSVADGGLAYQGAVGAEMWIKYWDGSEVHEIEKGDSPSLSEGRVAYTTYDSNYDVHYWDGTTIHEVESGQTHDAQPCLDGDWLVWVGRAQGEDGQIYYMRVRE